MFKSKRKRRAELYKDLKFYLDLYSKMPDRMKAEFDYEIQQIIEELKTMEVL